MRLNRQYRPDFVEDNIFSLKNTRVKFFRLPINIFAILTGIPEGWLKRYEAGKNLPGRKYYNKLAVFCGWDLWQG